MILHFADKHVGYGCSFRVGYQVNFELLDAWE